MPPSKIDDKQLLGNLTEAFRQYGYEGASLTRITDLCGLKRASLYHRFPGGKEEMAQAVLSSVDRWFTSHVLAPLHESGDPATRIRAMARQLKLFYASGRKSCLLNALSNDDATTDIQGHVRLTFQAWHGAMAAIARESGATTPAAKRRATDALVQIQGALVVARVTHDILPFKRVLSGLPALLINQKSE